MLNAHIFESTKDPIGTVIWLHGLGSCGNDYAPIVPHMQLPHVRFVLPDAPMRPITIDGGFESRAWYDVKTLEDSNKRASPIDIVESAELISELISLEKEKGIMPHQIILCGFDQGADMAYYMGMRLSQSLLGVVVMSGQSILDETLDTEVSKTKTPFLFCHGERDLLVRVERGWDARMRAKKFQRVTEWKEYVVGHEICMESLRDIRLWMHQRFATLKTSVLKSE